jgi:hypothetical protein
VDETTIRLDQVSINYLIFQSNSLFVHLVSFFGGASSFKRSALRPRGMSYDSLCVHSLCLMADRVYKRLSSQQPVWTLHLVQKKLKKQELTILKFSHVQDVCALERKRA